MFVQIIQKTPFWVWVLLLGLIALGYSQTRSRNMGLRRTIIMPVGMMALSLFGLVSAFGAHASVLGIWLLGYALVIGLTLRIPAPLGTAFHPETQHFSTPGSWLPMGVILAIFMTKYAVGVSLAMQPSLAHSDSFPLVIGFLYGLFSGFFAGRTLRMWRMAMV